MGIGTAQVQDPAVLLSSSRANDAVLLSRTLLTTSSQGVLVLDAPTCNYKRSVIFPSKRIDQHGTESFYNVIVLYSATRGQVSWRGCLH